MRLVAFARGGESYRKLTIGRKRQLLARVAADTFERSEYFVSTNRLAHGIAAYLRGLPRQTLMRTSMVKPFCGRSRHSTAC